jgi:hypothetical protein
MSLMTENSGEGERVQQRTVQYNIEYNKEQYSTI